MGLPEINTKPKNPNDKFHLDGSTLDFKLIDFWRWNQSDLIENRNRGILAEFIVRQALGIKYPTRLEWDAFDLKTEDGVKVEIKSAAYIQAWKQKRPSKISFDIAPTKTLLPDSNYSEEKSRHADVYVFCLLHNKDQNTIDPMDLSQWAFYIVTKETLDEKLPKQKSISISTIKTLRHEECTYDKLKDTFEKFINITPNNCYHNRA